jgi:uncharacterized ferritin-like protein (DUF455 family)
MRYDAASGQPRGRYRRTEILDAAVPHPAPPGAAMPARCDTPPAEASRPGTLAHGAVAVLAAAEPDVKVALSREVAGAWRGGDLAVGRADPPPRPARPPRPCLRSPRDMPKRRNFGSPAGRIALLHALAHIELNAIDLAWDLIARFGVARFGETCWPRAFFDDWVEVAAEEAEHFSLLSARLATLGSVYGDLPAHDGLWEAAAATAHDPLARLAVVPLVLEARGLDVTPAMRDRVAALGDARGGRLLQRILDDEIRHVAVGTKHFVAMCRAIGEVPENHWKTLVGRHFRGALKPPFNDSARLSAGLSREYYAGVA